MATCWTEVSATGLVIDPVTGEPTVLLEDHAASVIIPVPADPSTAGSLISEVEGEHSENAATLLYRFFVRHGVSVSRIELSQNRSGELAASFRYSYLGSEYGMEVRPVDGLLIAAQTQAPVVASPALIAAAGRSRSPRVRDGRDLLILRSRSRAK